MDRIAPSRLMQRIGIGAGVALVILLAIALTPPMIVRYRVHAFTSRLHAGMTTAELTDAASSMHLAARSANASEMAFPIDEPWTLSNCSTDYVVIVSLAAGRVTKWNPIKEDLCLKS